LSKDWTAGASETDEFMGEINVTAPASCGGYLSGAGLTIRTKVDDHQVAVDKIGSQQLALGATGTFPILVDRPAVIETGSPTQHTLDLYISGGCTPGDSSEQFRVNSLKVIVVGLR